MIFTQLNLSSKVILALFVTALMLLILYYSFKMIELAYVMKKQKPFFVHFYLFKRKLPDDQLKVLKQNFTFYNRLTKTEQSYFEHRVANFINDKSFIGREGQVISNEVKVLVSATAVMLTFGFRNFYIGLIEKIFVYPKVFFSNINQEYHKGEFNPKLKALVLSWEDFKHGYNVGDDNLNLGIHEFTHAIHLNSIKERDVSSTIFEDTFKELTNLLSKNKTLRDELIASKYFREYAYTNQFEFLAVIIESFIETPSDFRSQFPDIYKKTKQMLNFNFAGY